MTDLQRAHGFMTAHARLLDRRRFEGLVAGGDPGATLDALAAYRNDDGGFGWALHPDLRSTTSQPVAAIHVFEVLEEVAPATSAVAAGLCDWLGRVSLPDGGLPLALPFADVTGSTSMWAESDGSRSWRA